jgi:hypothetical protein
MRLPWLCSLAWVRGLKCGCVLILSQHARRMLPALQECGAGELNVTLRPVNDTLTRETRWVRVGVYASECVFKQVTPRAGSI